MGCKLSFFKFNNKSYKVSNSSSDDKSASSSTNQGQKSLSKEKIQLSQQNPGQKCEKSSKKNALPPLSNQSFIYKTVLETTVSAAETTEEEARVNAAEAPGPFEIETDLLSPEIEEAVIKIQANVRGYLTRKHRGITPDPPTVDIKSATESIGSPTILPTEILSPPPNFSDKLKNLSTTDNHQSLTQTRQKIVAEELEKKVTKVVNKPLESSVPFPIASEKTKQSLELSSGTGDNEQSSVTFGGIRSVFPKNDDFTENNGAILAQRPLEIPSIETSEYNGPEEAAIKIQAAFRGYQVRKTISRETSPCQNRDAEQVVHLREKDTNSTTQDHERESILVLDQLEECLSQELMKSTFNAGDEASFSSYSTDLDLDASLKSDTSLQILTLTQQIVNENSNSVIDLIENKQPESTETVDEAPFAKILDTVVSENAANKQIVEAIQTETPPISSVDQTPSVDCLDNRDSLSRDQVESETRENIPVLFIPTDEKVDAITDDTLQTDPVLVIELDCKLDASQIGEPNPQLKEKRTEIIKSHSMESPKELNTTINSFDNNDIENSTESAINQPKEINTEPAIEPLFFDMISPLTSTSSTSDNSKNDTTENFEDSEKFEQTTAPIPDVSSQLISSPLDKVSSDSRINTLDPVEDSKVIKLTKEDSFGSDILALGDEKCDILYDPFVDDLTENSTLLSFNDFKPVNDERLPSTSFIDDNLIKSIVDGSKSTEESSNLYDINLTMPTVSRDEISNTVLPSEIMSENISEVKDDILVDLDDSDQNDDDSQDSQERPVEVSKNSMDKSDIMDAIISSTEPDPKESRSNNNIESQSMGMNQMGKTTVDNEALQSKDESIKNNDIQDSTGNNQSKEITTKEPEIEPLFFGMVSPSDNQKNDSSSIEAVSIMEEQQNTHNDQVKVESTYDDGGATLSTEKSGTHAKVDHDFTVNTDIVHEKVITQDCELQELPVNLQSEIQSDCDGSEKLLPTDQESCNDLLTTTNTNKTQTVLSQNLIQSPQEPNLVTESEIFKSPEIVETIEKSKDLITSADIIVEPAEKEGESEKQEDSLKTTEIEFSQKQVKDGPSSSTTVIQSAPLIEIEFTSEDVKSRTFENSLSLTSVSATTDVNLPETSIKSSDENDNGDDLKAATNNEPSTSDYASKIKVEEAEAEVEAEGEDEESRENSHLYLRLQNREVRSKSPNPFCRAKKRRNKKNRGGANAN